MTIRKLSDEERLINKRLQSLKYYHDNKKKKKTPEEIEKRKQSTRKSSLKYYYKNQDKCIELSANYIREHKDKHRRNCMKSYYKKKGEEVFFINKQTIIPSINTTLNLQE